jgi:Histidine kinase-, DNA gyrase B-, and HSP90-like ATPase
MAPQKGFSGDIKVASQIVDYLSSGLYTSPAACLKELINNSYDADATQVDVFVKPDVNTIIISDNGIGMTRAEFQRHFDHVSESYKRADSPTTESGRLKVGKIGIGFIAANELCDVMEIVSTKQGSTELLRVEVNFAKMRTTDTSRRRVSGSDEIIKGDYVGEVENAEKDDHFTQVLLKEIRSGAYEILAGARERPHSDGEHSLYGRKPEAIVDLLASQTITNWGDLDEYSRVMLQVGLNVPVSYPPHWYPPDCGRILKKLDREVETLGFSVNFDGGDLRKPVYLEPGENDQHLLKAIKIDGTDISAKGYLYAKRTKLHPLWLQGVLIRIRSAAVGEYDNSFLGFNPSEAALFQNWTTAEIWADDRLEDALNIDRRTLKPTNPAYVELQEAFHDLLSDFFKEVRAKLYQSAAKTRKQYQATEEAQRFTDVIGNTKLPAAVQKDLRAVVRSSRQRAKDDPRTFLRKYSVAELYDVVLDVARDQMSERDFKRFAQTLAERLLD